jgi:competence ComEA-like helix-hairpin-helix protein
MLTPDERRAVALLSALVALGTTLAWLDVRHPRFLTLTLGDSLALGAPIPGSAPPEAPEAAPGAPSADSLPAAPDRAIRPTEPGAAPEKSAFGIDGRLDLNRASADELDGLPGVGPKTAERILEDRRVHGPFKKPRDLTRVKGIGPKTLERILPHVTVGAPRDSAR